MIQIQKHFGQQGAGSNYSIINFDKDAKKITEISESKGKYKYSKLSFDELETYHYTIQQKTTMDNPQNITYEIDDTILHVTIQQLPYNSSKWDIDDSTLNVEVEAYEDEDGMVQYYVEFVDQRNAFTNIDDTIEDDKSSEDEISVPQTLFNKNQWIIIIGFIMLLSGTAIIYKNTYNPQQ